MTVLRLLSAVALTMFVGCTFGRVTAPTPLRVRFVVPADVKLGDSAQFKLTVYNESSSVFRMTLSSSGAFDPLVRQGNDTIWQRSRKAVRIGVARETRMSAHDSLTFAAVWPLIDSDSRRPVKPGVYEVIAVLKDEDRRSLIGDTVRRVIRISPR
jgi:intracellular proteinase inhibitor BsuPI